MSAFHSRDLTGFSVGRDLYSKSLSGQKEGMCASANQMCVTQKREPAGVIPGSDHPNR
jgi:hypothetical protein